MGIEKLKERVRKRKGRGFTSDAPNREVLENFESISATDNEASDVQAQRCKKVHLFYNRMLHKLTG